jgi:hypothetical protein
MCSLSLEIHIIYKSRKEWVHTFSQSQIVQYKNACLQKISNMMSGVFGPIFCDSQDIFKYKNAIKGKFLSQK